MDNVKKKIILLLFIVTMVINMVGSESEIVSKSEKNTTEETWIKDKYTECVTNETTNLVTCSYSSKQRYTWEDEEFKRIEEARSLKDDYQIYFTEWDENYKVTVEDFNYTSIRYCLDSSLLKFSVPFTIIKEEERIYNDSLWFSNIIDRCYTVNFADDIFDKELKFGSNSTKLQIITDLNRTGTCEDDDGCVGSSPTCSLGGIDLDVGYTGANSGGNMESFITYNTTTIPVHSTILDILFVAYLSNEAWEGGEGEVINIYLCDYDSLTVADYGFQSSDLIGTIFDDDSAIGAYYSTTLTTNISLSEEFQICLNASGTCRDEYDSWRIEHSIAAYRPYLNITYQYYQETGDGQLGVHNNTFLIDEGSIVPGTKLQIWIDMAPAGAAVQLNEENIYWNTDYKQEFANQSGTVLGVPTGRYYSNFCTDNNWLDGDWITNTSDSSCDAFINYTVPVGATSANITALGTATNGDFKIYCWNYTDSAWTAIYSFPGAAQSIANVSIPSQCFQENTGNGTYTSQVFELNESFNNVNISANTYSWSGYEVEGSIREFLSLDADVVALWMEFAEGSTWKNYGSGGSDLDMTMPQATKYNWTDFTYNGSYGTSGSYHLGGSPNPGFRTVNDDGKILNMSTFMICSWGNLTGGYEFWRGNNDIMLSEIGDTYRYVKFDGLTDTEWDWFRPNGREQRTGNWTFLCIGYNSSHFVSYQDGSWLQGDATTGTVDWANEHHIGLYSLGNIAMLFVLNGTKGLTGTNKTWYDEVYNFTRMSWQPESDYQSFSNGWDTNQYAIDGDTNFVQAKFKLKANSTDSTILYSFNVTGKNMTVEEEDTTPPYITVAPNNISTTNESIKWDVTFSEVSNMSGTYGVCQDYVSNSFLNNTFATTLSSEQTGLTNGTQYCYNMTGFCDVSDNCNTSNYLFNFTTGPTIISGDCWLVGDKEILIPPGCEYTIGFGDNII